MDMRVFAIALLALIPCLGASPEFDKGKITGNPSAPIRIEIFSDFQCPACKLLHDQLLPALTKDYVMSGKVYVVNHEFPLPMHPYSREAAQYATAAARFGIYSRSGRQRKGVGHGSGRSQPRTAEEGADHGKGPHRG